jgi:hypothetical protein
MKRAILVFVLACGGAPGPNVTAVTPVAAPAAREEPDAPRVSVAGDAVLVDGVAAGDVREALAEKKPRRIDALFDAMKQKRERWKAAHPGQPFPGHVWLSFPPGADAAVVKSVFQTCAFAGFPNGRFVVPDTPGRVLDIDAHVPGPGREPEVLEDDVVLHVVLAARGAKLVWRRGGLDVSSEEVSSSSALAGRVAATWKTTGGHRDASDAKLDQAVLYADTDVDYARIVEALIAIAGATRELRLGGSVERVPALNVTFAIAPSPAPPGPLLRRIPAEQIRAAIQEHRETLQGCHLRAGKKQPALRGTLVVSFRIETDGKARDVTTAEGTTITDPAMIACVVHAFESITFPKEGRTTVTYPLKFGGD